MRAAVSSFREIEPSFDALNPIGETVNSVRDLSQSYMDLSDFDLQCADPLLYLTHIVAQAIHGPTDGAQMLKHDVVDLSHPMPQAVLNRRAGRNRNDRAEIVYRHSTFFTS